MPQQRGVVAGNIVAGLALAECDLTIGKCPPSPGKCPPSRGGTEGCDPSVSKGGLHYDDKDDPLGDKLSRGQASSAPKGADGEATEVECLSAGHEVGIQQRTEAARERRVEDEVRDPDCHQGCSGYGARQHSLGSSHTRGAGSRHPGDMDEELRANLDARAR